jgi:predicted dinucleotide-binding enzyme
METVAILGYGRFGSALGQLFAEAGIAHRAFDVGLSVSRWETFMKLVARTTRRAWQVESFAQPGQSALSGTLIRPPLAHHLFEVSG